MPCLRASGRSVAIAGFAGAIFAASCQGQIGNSDTARGGDSGGQGVGGAVIGGNGGSAQSTGGTTGSGGSASGGVSGTGGGGKGGAAGSAGDGGGGAGGGAGSSARGGTSGAAGSAGGRGGAGGGSGGAGGGTGGTARGGTGGNAGSGSGGGAGNGSSGSSGSGGSGGSGGGPPPTFTSLYASLFGTSMCAGTLCHNPGIQKTIDLSTQAKAYTSLKLEVVPGNGAGSALYRILMDGTMPPDPPKVMTDQVEAVRAWIDAGALNN